MRYGPVESSSKKVAAHRRNKQKLVSTGSLYLVLVCHGSYDCIRVSRSALPIGQNICRREQNQEDENGHLFLSVSFILLDGGARISWISLVCSFFLTFVERVYY